MGKETVSVHKVWLNTKTTYLPLIGLGVEMAENTGTENQMFLFFTFERDNISTTKRLYIILKYKQIPL
jgi:hypothetical protein